MAISTAGSGPSKLNLQPAHLPELYSDPHFSIFLYKFKEALEGSKRSHQSIGNAQRRIPVRLGAPFKYDNGPIGFGGSHTPMLLDGRPD
jgi:hypothetical protein